MRTPIRVVAAVLLASSVLASLGARPSEGLPLYAARQGLMCQSCHFDPNGGGPRNDFGFMFARNRHSLEPDTASAWKDLAIGNRVSETVPIYFGVDQRFMLLSNAHQTVNPAERAGFFNMENALYVTFQPHPQLTLVYSRDAFNDAVLAQDAFGVISGLPLDGYVKAGRFRTPFGLRMDDHTVATRVGYLNLTGGPSFLPYDSRFPDMGLEVGGDRSGWFGRAAFTNGASQPFGSQPFAQTGTAKFGWNGHGVQVAGSFYDDYEKTGAFPFRRASRWGTYALAHAGPLQFIGEIGAGTDRYARHDSRGHAVNLAAAFGEVDWTPNRSVNVRLRADRLQLDRDETLVERPDGSRASRRALSTFDRYAIESEFLPVPFGEIRCVYRVIAPVAGTDAFGGEQKHERQGYVQFHFSY